MAEFLGLLLNPMIIEWRTNIGTEFRNCHKTKKGCCYYNISTNAGRFIFIDKKNHATQHLGTTLLNRCLNKLDFNDLLSSYEQHRNGNSSNGLYEKLITFQCNIGYDESVETTDDDKIIYAVRQGRDKKSRIALNRQPSPSNKVFLMANKSILASGTPCEIMNEHNLQQTYGVRVKINKIKDETQCFIDIDYDDI